MCCCPRKAECEMTHMWYTVAVMKELGLITQIKVVSMLEAGLNQLTFSQGGRQCLKSLECTH